MLRRDGEGEVWPLPWYAKAEKKMKLLTLHTDSCSSSQLLLDTCLYVYHEAHSGTLLACNKLTKI